MSIFFTAVGLPLRTPDDVDPFLTLLEAVAADDVAVVAVDEDADVVVDGVLRRTKGDDNEEEPIPLPRMLGATMSL